MASESVIENDDFTSLVANNCVSGYSDGYGRWINPRTVQPVQPWNPGPTGTGIYPVKPEDLIPKIDPCVEKHVIEEVAQYPDGVFGNCKTCGARIEIPTVPGGYTAMQIRGFLERVVAGENPEEDGELLAELGNLIMILDMELDELELAKKRVEIAKQVLLERSA